MIEINLLPEEAKIKLKKHASSAAAKQVYKVISLVVALVILVHLGLFAALTVKNMQYNSLNKKWKTLRPQLESVEEFRGSGGSYVGGDAIQQLVAKRVNWGIKLNKLSLNLPNGVWFNELFVTGKNFKINGSVVSLQKDEMGMINQFIDNLKKDSGFYSDFTNLELNSADSEEIGGYQVTNFGISGTLK